MQKRIIFSIVLLLVLTMFFLVFVNANVVGQYYGPLPTTGPTECCENDSFICTRTPTPTSILLKYVYIALIIK